MEKCGGVFSIVNVENQITKLCEMYVQAANNSDYELLTRAIELTQRIFKHYGESVSVPDKARLQTSHEYALSKVRENKLDIQAKIRGHGQQAERNKAYAVMALRTKQG